MKTAEDYIKGHKPNSEYPSYYHESDVEEMINEARKECLEEAAERAEADNYEDGRAFVKKSILNLIKELR